MYYRPPALRLGRKFHDKDFDFVRAWSLLIRVLIRVRVRPRPGSASSAKHGVLTNLLGGLNRVSASPEEGFPLARDFLWER